jgi:PAS domain S-box-containing protein
MEGLGDTPWGGGRAPAGAGADDPYRQFLESVALGFCLVELVRDSAGRAVDHRIVDANAAFGRHTGLADACGRLATELAPDIEETWHALYAEVADSRAPRRVESFSHALGRWFDVFVAPFGTDADRVAVLFHDVTAEKQAAAEAQARSREHAQLLELVQALFDNAPGALWAKDAEGRLLLTNTHLEWLLGHERGALRGKSGYDLFPKEAADVLHAHDMRAAAGEVVLRAEETIPTPRGMRTYLSNKFPVRGPPELPAVVAGVSVDITERKQAEEQLQRSEARLRTVIETGVIGVLFWHVGGRITFANDSLLRMLGLTREEAGALDWRGLTPREHRAQDDALVRRLGEGEPVTFEKEYLHADGSRVPVLVAASPFPDAPESGVAFVVDLTEQKRVHAELEEQIAFEERLVGVVGHDLRNPLSSAKLHLNLVLRDAGLPAAARGRLQRLQDVLGVMERIVGDLLDLARIRAGRGLPIDPTPLDLSELCAHLAEEAVALFPEAAVQVDAPVPVTGSWDRTRLSQAVMNLLTNAIKHGTAGQPVRLGVRLDGDRAQVSVHNAGAPIPPAQLATLFDAYARGEASTGLGLGLYIVREIARAHGGDVRAESSQEAGTTFTLTVPRRTA